MVTKSALDKEYTEKDSELQRLQEIADVEEAALARKQPRVYSDIVQDIAYGGQTIVKACILDPDGTELTATKEVKVSDLCLTLEEKEQDEFALCNVYSRVKSEETVVDGLLYNIDARTHAVTFCGEIGVMRVNPLRYFRQAIVAISKKRSFVLRQGQLVSSAGSSLLAQIIALCLAPPSPRVMNGHSKPMLLIVYADATFQEVYNLVCYMLYILIKPAASNCY